MNKTTLISPKSTIIFKVIGWLLLLDGGFWFFLDGLSIILDIGDNMFYSLVGSSNVELHMLRRIVLDLGSAALIAWAGLGLIRMERRALGFMLGSFIILLIRDVAAVYRADYSGLFTGPAIMAILILVCWHKRDLLYQEQYIVDDVRKPDAPAVAEG